MITFAWFLYCAKEGIVQISKVSQSLEKQLPSCKGGRKCKNKFLNQSLLHPVIFQKRKLQIFVSSFISCFLQWGGWLHYECVRISALNTTLDIYLLFENSHKSTQTRRLTFVLLVSFLLTLNTFHTLIQCYYSYFEKVNVS